VHPEALIVHLALTKEAVLEGNLHAVERHPQSGSFGMGEVARALLYLWRSMLALTAWQLFVTGAAAVSLFALTRRLASRRAALVATAAFLAMPVVVIGTMTAANDLLAAAFVFSALLALVRWRQECHSVSA